MLSITAKIKAAKLTDSYIGYHAPRYAFIIKRLSGYMNDSSKILDVGRSKLTDLVAEIYNRSVDSLGLEQYSKTNTGVHYHFDLNDCQYKEKWPSNIPRYDIIVMAEVIEHLYTSPSLVMAFLKTLLNPNGILIIQTPNAAVLYKRIKLLFGCNPYEMIREDTVNPGHFREYTKKELMSNAMKLGFSVEKCFLKNYFDYRYYPHRASKSFSIKRYLGVYLYNFVPKSMKPGITIVLKLSK